MQTTHILIVDDEPSVGIVLSALLRQAGHRVTVASSGSEALAQLSNHSIQLVLTDLCMPEMDGLGLLARIKTSWPHIPVVLLTAHGTVPSAVAAMKAGADDYLLKPFDREELKRTLARVLSSASQPTPAAAAQGTDGAAPLSLEQQVRVSERAAIEQALVQARGNRSLAAKLLGISRRTLYNKLDELGLP